MKIVAFAGSNSSTSINKKLVKHTLTYFPNEEINLLDLNDFSLPLFSEDEEKKGYPEAVNRFIQTIDNADVIVCSMAEHNQNFTAAFKNLFDWASRINRQIFQNKSMLLMSTSTGGFGGGNVMNLAQKTFPNFGANIKATFSLPKFNENFDAEKGIINAELKTAHEEAINTFKSESKE